MLGRRHPDAEPQANNHAAPFLTKRGAAFFVQLQERADFLAAEFGAIDAIGLWRSFVAGLAQARRNIEPSVPNASG